MNERIAEIKHLCYIEGSQDRYDMEKFAELIVKECERVAKDPQWYSDRPSDGWCKPIKHVCNVMKDYFGVK